MLGCGGSDRPSKPDDLIPADQMSAIFYDIFILNAAKGVNKKLLDKNGILPQEYVYKKYSIDSLQFAQSNNYYSYDTKIYEGIVARVKQKIELEKKLNDSIILIEEKEKDSIRSRKIETKDTIENIIGQPKIVDTLPAIKPQLKPKIFGQGDDD